jgi:hypothetical protein
MKFRYGLLVLLPSLGYTQGGGTLSLSLASTDGATATLNVTWSPHAGVAALEWTLSPNTVLSVSAGAALMAAAKDVQCAARPQEYICIASGRNRNAIPAGVIARLSMTAQAAAAVRFLSALGASTQGDAVLVSTAVAVALPPPLTLSSLVCNPPSLTGAGVSTCTVTLNRAAPAGGAAIALSDNSAYLSMPASVVVAAGAVRATFTVTVAAAPALATPVITARLNGAAKGATLTLLPRPALSSIACSAATIASGASTSCTVTLTSPAASGGALVALSDSSAALTIPPSLTIPAGAAFASFTATARAVAANENATIHAAYAGRTQSFLLTVTRAPTRSLTSVQCNPAIVPAQGSSSCVVTLSGPAPIGGLRVTLSDNAAGFTLPSSVTVPAGSATASVTGTAPLVSTDQTVTVTAALNGVVKTAVVTIHGTGLVGWWKLDATSGTAVTDASGSGNHGAVVGRPVWTSGVSIGALQLDGASFVAVPDSASLRLTGHALSFGGWYYHTSRAHGYLLGKNIFTLMVAQAYEFAAQITAGGVRRVLSFSVPGGLARFNNTWVHVLVTYDGAAIRAYVNGALAATRAAAGDLANHTGPLTIGDHGGPGDSWARYNGPLDDVRLYNRALSASEAQMLYLAPGQLR